jgi:hypothetical protein
VNVAVELVPITATEVDTAARFLTTHLNARVPEREWTRAMTMPWSSNPPNHGYMLCDGDQVVGVHLAYYSNRVIDGAPLRFCNLGAWCVLDGYRDHGLRLLLALVRQKGYELTDFSPSGQVVDINKRLKFTELDTSTAIVPNVPIPLFGRECRVLTDPSSFLALLSPIEQVIYHDHQRAAVRHVALVAGSDVCYVMFRRDRRKGLPLFASILYISDAELFRRYGGRLAWHLLSRHRAVATLVELRLSLGRPKRSIMLRSHRPKMFRGSAVDSSQIDYLYSELTNLEW